MTDSKFPTRVAGFAGALVAIDLVDAGPVVAGIALAVVNVDFAVDSCQKKRKKKKTFSKLKSQRRVT